MTETSVKGLPAGAFILWCNNTPIPVRKDPATMTASERDAICSGINGTFKIDLDLTKLPDGSFEVKQC